MITMQFEISVNLMEPDKITGVFFGEWNANKSMFFGNDKNGIERLKSLQAELLKTSKDTPDEFVFIHLVDTYSYIGIHNKDLILMAELSGIAIQRFEAGV